MRAPVRSPGATPFLALASMVVLSGCVSERAPLGPPRERAECALPLHAVRRGDHIVLIHQFSFTPETLRVAVGTTVTWVNCEAASTEAHTTTSRQAAWGSPLLRRGEHFSHTFTARGRYAYACLPHAIMRGEVVVE